MTILLLILKIIGIILLSLLGIVLLVLFYILVLPITYRLFGSYAAGTPEGFVCFYDPLRLIYFRYSRDTDGGNTCFKLLWGLIKSGGEQDEEEDDFPEEEIEEYEESVYEEDISEDDSEDSDFEMTEETEDIEVPAEIESEQPTEEDSAAKETESKEAESKDLESEKSYDDETVHDDSYDFEQDDSFDEEFDDEPDDESEDDESDEEETESRAAEIIEMIYDEGNQRAVMLLLDKVIKLLKHIKPHIKSADIDYSLGAPHITGQITGAVAMLPVTYDKNVNISPDFASEEAYAVGHIHLKGHVRLIVPVAYAIVIIANRDCRRLYKQIKN